MRLAGHPNIVAVKDAKNDITGWPRCWRDRSDYLPATTPGCRRHRWCRCHRDLDGFTGRRTAELIDAWLAATRTGPAHLSELLPVYTGCSPPRAS